ncbi:DMT family transporter [Vibrio mangrovi]|uniref:EamA family transporter n=1 Tax=Vibrio mangrovi TaxID=474394 RepID=A0A1Y6IR44_9VIBR|nr:EamA family transporter [Vibrio mangrovi]MDW6001834.1 EamA family transporter [Vibrio mangrovi]SMS00139.1 EamA-like transporter family protein [Vibrio mangrovi]
MLTITRPLRKKTLEFPFTEILLLLVALCWGTSYGLTQSALLYSAVLPFIAVRFSMTTLCLLPVVIRDFRRGMNRDWKVSIPTGLVLSAIFFCEVFGVFYTSAAKAAFLISLTVVLTAIAEAGINKQRVSRVLVMLTVCSVLGVLLLTGYQGVSFSFNSGDYLILSAAILRALMTTLTRQLTKGKIITTATLTALQSGIVALMAIVTSLLSMPVSALKLPTEPEFWLTVVYLVLCCTLFAFYVQNDALRKISPTRVALLMGSEPLFGALFAIFWLQESLSWSQWLGGIMILFSVIMTSVKGNQTSAQT